MQGWCDKDRSVPMKVTTKNINEVKEAIKSYEDKFKKIHELGAFLVYLYEANEFTITYEKAPVVATLGGRVS